MFADGGYVFLSLCPTYSKKLHGMTGGRFNTRRTRPTKNKSYLLGVVEQDLAHDALGRGCAGLRSIRDCPSLSSDQIRYFDAQSPYMYASHP